jgi:predicted metal-binding protein
MVKKRIDERLCRDCGKLIIGRRSDAIVCKDCRDKARERFSKRKREKDNKEKFWKKVEDRGVKSEIEFKKVREMIENLEKGLGEDIDAKAFEVSF